MRRVLVLHGPGLDLDLAGLTSPAPGTRERLERWCTRWAEHVDVEIEQWWCTTVDHVAVALRSVSALGADAVVIGMGAREPLDGLRGAAESLGRPVVEVHQRSLEHPYPRVTTGAASIRRIHGRGFIGYRAALAHIAAREACPFRTIPYGPTPDHVGDLRLPESSGSPPVAVLLHGGFWWHAWERDQMDQLAVDLTSRGYATWNLEYRRVGAGGGWPATVQDVAEGLDHLAKIGDAHRLDLTRVTLVGHSAGAQLALWLASRAREEVAGSPRVEPQAVLALAPVADLEAVHRQHPRGGSVGAFLGADAPGLLPLASPRTLVPLGVPHVVVHGTADEQVDVAGSRAYVEAARAAGDAVTYLELHEVGHWSLIDARSDAWGQAVEALDRLRLP